MAFQPIVDVEARNIFAFEALVREPGGTSAWPVIQKVNDENRYAFDQSCRVKAIALAARLSLVDTGALVAINFMPNAVYNPANCIQLTLQAAELARLPLDRIILEVTETERVASIPHLRRIAEEYRRLGIRIALDDFGAGYCGFSLLAEIPADIIKLDMALTRRLHERPTSFAVVKPIVDLCHSLGSRVVAEGIESVDEYRALRDCGIQLMQGYLFARPAFEALPPVTFPD